MNSKRSIANKSIFGEYKQPENRVTAALLQIFRIGGPELISHVFEDYDLDLDVEVNTQVGKKESVPDGELKANYHLYIESKVKPWTDVKFYQHNVDQFKKHKSLVEDGSAKLLYITIEDNRPQDIEEDDYIIWMNWKTIVQKLEGYEPSFNKDVIGFLVAQFALLIENVVTSKYDGTTDDNRVAIVGGRFAEKIAIDHKFYACQPDRAFRKSKYLAFYFDKRIAHVFEIIEGPIQVKSLKVVAAKLGGYTLNSGDEGPRTFFKLGDEVQLDHKEIIHDSRVAYVRLQRYTTIDLIQKAKTTRDL